MLVREYNKNDDIQVIELYNKCFDGKVDEINIDSSGTVLIMEIDNKIVGMGTIDILNDMFRNIRYGYLNNICINPDYQNKGLGTILINEIEKYAKENNCEYLMLTSNKSRISAHKLYLKNGYEIIDTCVFRKNIN